MKPYRAIILLSALLAPASAQDLKMAAGQPLSPKDALKTFTVAPGFRIDLVAAEPDVMDPENSVVVSCPTLGPQTRIESEVSVWEKAALAAVLQKHWADNQVSATLTFAPEEADQIGPLLHAMDGQLKVVSFLPLTPGGAYAQLPYERISREQWGVQAEAITRVDTEALYSMAKEAEGEAFCSNDICQVDLG